MLTNRTTRRTVLAGGAMLLVAAGRFDQAVAQDATPDAAPAGNLEAVELITDAASVMTELDTFQFSLVTTEGETEIFEGFTLEEIAGAIRRPTDFETTVTVAIPFATLDLTAVSIGNEVWIELPSLGENEGGWTSLGSSAGILTLLNPDVLILESVRYIDDAAIEGTGEVDGVPVTFVTGTVDFQEIAARLGGDTALQSELAEGPAEVQIAIDEENRIRQIEIAGPLLATEADDV
ncbi:MAG: LppX_LprAFG lipoprotein, partial [Chloroflexota bacterium]|nr:LppX_LprAFG lipoprotein [Chloroflexota bacterium]